MTSAALQSSDRGAAAASLRRAGETQDIFHIAFDPAANLIRASARGCWSIDETRRYLGGLDRFVRMHRATAGFARVLLDRREVSDQSSDVVQLLAKANGDIFREDDKIALIVGSSLAKAGLRQRLPHPGSKAFLSIEAAEVWLSAFAKPAQARMLPIV